MSKEKFMFFQNFKAIADKLDDDMRLKFYDALTNYVFNDEESTDVIISALIEAIKPSLDKVDGRQNNGGNHNPNGVNQHTKVSNSGQNRTKLVNSGQFLSETETETETETRESIERKDPKEVRGAFIPPTLDDFLIWAKNMDDSAGVGGFECSKQQAIEFWNHYNSQDWKKGNGLPITNLRSAFISWTKKDDRFQQMK